MAASKGAARWDDVASRCLTCGNCTMVCPTCFCTTVEDTSDLTGEHAERWQTWDSCFDLDFSYLHGGSVRVSARAATGSGSPTSSAPGMTSSARRAASAAAGASSGARSASTSQRRWPPCEAERNGPGQLQAAEAAARDGRARRAQDRSGQRTTGRRRNMTGVTPPLTAHPRFLRGMTEEHIALARLRSPLRLRCRAGTGSSTRAARPTGSGSSRPGQVALDLHVPGHGPVIIETLGRGDVIGWSWLFPPFEWLLGAVTMQPTQAFELDGRRCAPCVKPTRRSGTS